MTANRVPRTFALRTLLLAVLVSAVGLTAYRNRPRGPSLDLVEKGMTFDEVIDAIGKPDDVMYSKPDGGAAWLYFLRQHGFEKLLVRFEGGRVRHQMPICYLQLEDYEP